MEQPSVSGKICQSNHLFNTYCDLGSGDEADYDSIVAQSVSFTNIDRSQNVLITIFGDSFTEINETFSAMLSSVFIADSAGGQAMPLSAQELSRLFLSPNMADITILDDDGEISWHLQSPINNFSTIVFCLQRPPLDL